MVEKGPSYESSDKVTSKSSKEHIDTYMSSRKAYLDLMDKEEHSQEEINQQLADEERAMTEAYGDDKAESSESTPEKKSSSTELSDLEQAINSIEFPSNTVGSLSIDSYNLEDLGGVQMAYTAYSKYNQNIAEYASKVSAAYSQFQKAIDIYENMNDDYDCWTRVGDALFRDEDNQKEKQYEQAIEKLKAAKQNYLPKFQEAEKSIESMLWQSEEAGIKLDQATDDLKKIDNENREKAEESHDAYTAQLAEAQEENQRQGQQIEGATAELQVQKQQLEEYQQGLQSGLDLIKQSTISRQDGLSQCDVLSTSYLGRLNSLIKTQAKEQDLGEFPVLLTEEMVVSLAIQLSQSGNFKLFGSEYDVILQYVLTVDDAQGGEIMGIIQKICDNYNMKTELTEQINSMDIAKANLEQQGQAVSMSQAQISQQELRLKEEHQKVRDEINRLDVETENEMKAQFEAADFFDAESETLDKLDRAISEGRLANNISNQRSYQAVCGACDGLNSLNPQKKSVGAAIWDGTIGYVCEGAKWLVGGIAKATRGINDILKKGIFSIFPEHTVVGKVLTFPMDLATGVVDGAAGLVEGILTLVQHPIEGLNGLGALIGRDPLTGERSLGTAGDTWKNFGKMLIAADKWDENAGEALGNAIANIGSFFIGGGVIGAGGTAAKLAGAACKLSKAGKLATMARVGGSFVLGAGKQAGKVMYGMAKGIVTAPRKLPRAIYKKGKKIVTRDFCQEAKAMSGRKPRNAAEKIENSVNGKYKEIERLKAENQSLLKGGKSGEYLKNVNSAADAEKLMSKLSTEGGEAADAAKAGQAGTAEAKLTYGQAREIVQYQYNLARMESLNAEILAAETFLHSLVTETGTLTEIGKVFNTNKAFRSTVMDIMRNPSKAPQYIAELNKKIGKLPLKDGKLLKMPGNQAVYSVNGELKVLQTTGGDLVEVSKVSVSDAAKIVDTCKEGEYITYINKKGKVVRFKNEGGQFYSVNEQGLTVGKPITEKALARQMSKSNGVVADLKGDFYAANTGGKATAIEAELGTEATTAEQLQKAQLDKMREGGILEIELNGEKVTVTKTAQGDFVRVGSDGQVLEVEQVINGIKAEDLAKTMSTGERHIPRGQEVTASDFAKVTEQEALSYLKNLKPGETVQIKVPGGKPEIKVYTKTENGFELVIKGEQRFTAQEIIEQKLLPEAKPAAEVPSATTPGAEVSNVARPPKVEAGGEVVSTTRVCEVKGDVLATQKTLLSTVPEGGVIKFTKGGKEFTYIKGKNSKFFEGETVPKIKNNGKEIKSILEEMEGGEVSLNQMYELERQYLQANGTNKVLEITEGGKTTKYYSNGTSEIIEGGKTTSGTWEVNNVDKILQEAKGEVKIISNNSGNVLYTRPGTSVLEVTRSTTNVFEMTGEETALLTTVPERGVIKFTKGGEEFTYIKRDGRFYQEGKSSILDRGKSEETLLKEMKGGELSSEQLCQLEMQRFMSEDNLALQIRHEGQPTIRYCRDGKVKQLEGNNWVEKGTWNPETELQGILQKAEGEVTIKVESNGHTLYKRPTGKSVEVTNTRVVAEGEPVRPTPKVEPNPAEAPKQNPSTTPVEGGEVVNAGAEAVDVAKLEVGEELDISLKGVKTKVKKTSEGDFILVKENGEPLLPANNTELSDIEMAKLCDKSEGVVRITKVGEYDINPIFGGKDGGTVRVSMKKPNNPFTIRINGQQNTYVKLSNGKFKCTAQRLSSDEVSKAANIGKEVPKKVATPAEAPKPAVEVGTPGKTIPEMEQEVGRLELELQNKTEAYNNLYREIQEAEGSAGSDLMNELAEAERAKNAAEAELNAAKAELEAARVESSAVTFNNALNALNESKVATAEVVEESLSQGAELHYFNSEGVAQSCKISIGENGSLVITGEAPSFLEGTLSKAQAAARLVGKGVKKWGPYLWIGNFDPSRWQTPQNFTGKEINIERSVEDPLMIQLLQCSDRDEIKSILHENKSHFRELLLKNTGEPGKFTVDFTYFQKWGEDFDNTKYSSMDNIAQKQNLIVMSIGLGDILDNGMNVIVNGKPGKIENDRAISKETGGYLPIWQGTTVEYDPVSPKTNISSAPGSDIPTYDI